MPLTSTTDASGTITMRHVGRHSLPEGDVPKSGRRLTTQQFNDAMMLVTEGMGPGIVRKADAADGLEALRHILGHVVAVENELAAVQRGAEVPRG